jgi:hypothetical protein
VKELMILVNAVDIPLTIDAKVLVVVLNVFEFTKLAEVVATTPLVILVNMKLLVVVAILRVLVVDEAKRDEREVVAVTPLILVVKRPVEVA